MALANDGPNLYPQDTAGMVFEPFSDALRHDLADRMHAATDAARVATGSIVTLSDALNEERFGGRFSYRHPELGGTI